MNLWNRVEQELGDGVDALRKGLADILDFTEDLTRKGKIKLEIQRCRRALQDRLTRLGERVYDVVVEEKSKAVLKDGGVQSIFNEIDELKRQIKAHEVELEEIKSAEDEASDQEGGRANP